MKNKKQKDISAKQLFSNTVFVLKFLYKTNRILYFIRIPMLLLQVVSTFIPIIFVRYILNAVTVENSMYNAMIYVMAMAILTFVVSVLSNIFSSCDQKQVARTRYLANLALGKSVMRLRYEDLERPETKSFVTLAQEDSMLYILTLVSNFISSIIKVAGLTAIVLTFQPLILVLIAAVIAVKMFIDKKRRQRLQFYRSVWAPINRKSSYIVESMREIQYAKEIRVNDLSGWLCKKLQEHLDSEVYPLNKKSEKENCRLNMFTTVTGILQECVVYFILAYRVIFAGMSIGDFSMYMTSIKNFTDSVTGVFWNYSRLIIMSRFAREFRYCIELEKNIKKQGTEHLTDHGNPRDLKIEFRNVSFTYPDTDKVILKNISITIDPHESLSIVGINGAGKTTFVKLLCRLYEPTEGEILVNGIPIQKIPLDEYYDLLGVVFQDFKLFSFSVRENVCLDTVGDDSRLAKCMEKSGLADKMGTLPNKFDTMINKEFDDFGIEFSGGEGQKLAIARALYKDAPLIILDEPTSALDPIAEYEIYSRFHQLTDGKSTIYISHRLSSTRFTDKIAVFSEGELCEYGNHNELMQIDGGVYKNMFEMQAQYYI